MRVPRADWAPLSRSQVEKVAAEVVSPDLTELTARVAAIEAELAGGGSATHTTATMQNVTLVIGALNPMQSNTAEVSVAGIKWQDPVIANAINDNQWLMLYAQCIRDGVVEVVAFNSGQYPLELGDFTLRITYFTNA